MTPMSFGMTSLSVSQTPLMLIALNSLLLLLLLTVVVPILTQSQVTATSVQLVPNGRNIATTPAVHQPAHFNGSSNGQIGQSNLRTSLRLLGIFGGDLVPSSGRYPFAVSLQFEGQVNFCGASILNDDSLLTAAHCFYQPNPYNPEKENIFPNQVQAYLGHVDVASPKDSEYLFQVLSWSAHPKYTKGRTDLGYDLGVVKLARRIDFSSLVNVSKVCLPSPSSNSGASRSDDQDQVDKPDTAKCVVIGWGKTEDGNPSDLLKQVTVPMLNGSDCEAYSPTLTMDQSILTCAGYESGNGKDSCQGDSGGPLVCPSKVDGKWLQYGIVSFGDDCGQGPGFYTRPEAFIDWIQQQAEGGSDG